MVEWEGLHTGKKIQAKGVVVISATYPHVDQEVLAMVEQRKGESGSLQPTLNLPTGT